MDRWMDGDGWVKRFINRFTHPPPDRQMHGQANTQRDTQTRRLRHTDRYTEVSRQAQGHTRARTRTDKRRLRHTKIYITRQRHSANIDTHRTHNHIQARRSTPDHVRRRLLIAVLIVPSSGVNRLRMGFDQPTKSEILRRASSVEEGMAAQIKR